jgi:predicted GIY-YIG superfamily endonuclease
VYYVYIIKSIVYPDQIYFGYTTNVEERLIKHNSGDSIHTAKYRPWQLVISIEFADASKVIAFEKYLKSGSGRAFAAKRFL